MISDDGTEDTLHLIYWRVRRAFVTSSGSQPETISFFVTAAMDKRSNSFTDSERRTETASFIYLVSLSKPGSRIVCYRT